MRIDNNCEIVSMKVIYRRMPPTQWWKERWKQQWLHRWGWGCRPPRWCWRRHGWEAPIIQDQPWLWYLERYTPYFISISVQASLIILISWQIKTIYCPLSQSKISIHNLCLRTKGVICQSTKRVLPNADPNLRKLQKPEKWKNTVDP